MKVAKPSTIPSLKYLNAQKLFPSKPLALLEQSSRIKQLVECARSRAVALALTVSTATCLWALWVCLSPQRLAAEERQPLVMIATEQPDGSLLSYARFEIWPVLAATLALGLGVFVYGLLRAHWRRAGLRIEAPTLPAPDAQRLLLLALASLALYGLRLVLEHADWLLWLSYVPIVGGVLETAVVYLAWLCFLDCRRRARPLAHERRLWLGLFLALLPPVYDFARHLLSFSA